MLSRDDITNQVNNMISFGGDSFFKVVNKVSIENKQLVLQFSQKTCHAIKSWWEPLRTSCSDINVSPTQNQAKIFCLPSNTLDPDKDFILAEDQKNLEDQLKKIRDIIPSDKNKGLDFENKDFLLQIDSLLEEIKETKSILANRWSVIHGITNSLFLLFTKEKFDLNEKNLMAKILLIIIGKNNLSVEQVRLIKKFNKYLNTRANSELDDFIKELDKLKLLKQAHNAICTQEMKEIANSLKKLNYKPKKIRTRTIGFYPNGMGFCVEDEVNRGKRILSEEIKRLASIDVEKNNLIVGDKLSQGEAVLLEEFKRLENIDLEKIECPDESSVEEECSLEEKNELLYAKLWGRIESIEKSGRIRADKIAKRRLTGKPVIDKAPKQALERLLSPIKREIEEFYAKEDNAVNEACFDLPRFEASNNNFINYINFKDFKELISVANKIFLSIKEIALILKKIGDFYYDLNGCQIYSEYFNQEIVNFNRNFNKADIVVFLKNALKLFEEYKLDPSKANRFIFHKSNNKFEEITFSNQARLDEFVYSNRLESIIKNQKTEIKAYLDRYFHKDILFNEKILENKVYRDGNLFKYFFEKIKKFIINFSRNYFMNRESKLAFINKLKENIGSAAPFNSVNNFVSGLKWWRLIFYGINPFCLYKKGFKRKLAEQLFLALIDEDFKKVVNNLEIATDHTARIQHTDGLSDIIARLRSLNRSDRGNIGEKSKSRHEIINELKKDVIKELPKKLLHLKEQANLSLSQFSELLNWSKTTIEALEQAKKEENNVSAGSESNSYFLNWLQRQSKEVDTESKTSFPRQHAFNT
ncbi:MAG: hypothetical protein WCB98_05920 [Candidatus Aquirickettsiella gammari]